MCKLGKKQQQVLEALLTAHPDVVAIRLKISKQYISNVKTRARRKEAKAKKFLQKMRRYRSVLHKEKQYSGI